MFQRCMLQIRSKNVKIRKGGTHLLIHLLRLIRTVLAEITGILLRKSILA